MAGTTTWEFVSTASSSNSSRLASTVSLEGDSSATIYTSMNMQLAYFIIGSLGVLGNFVIAFVIFSVRSLRKKITNVFIINQSLLDLVVSFFLMATFNVDSVVPWDDIRGQLLCKLWQTKLFLWSFLVSSTYNLVALTVERYLAVLHPIWHKVSFQRKHALLCIGAVWLFGPAWNSSYMIVTSVVVNGQCELYSRWPSPTVRKIFGVLTVSLQFLVPLCILVFCYSAIALALHRKMRENKASQGQEEKLSRGRRNTVKTLAMVAACFVLCWAWNQVYYLLMNLGFREDYESNFYHFTVLAVFTNSCINPVIYGLKYEPFKKAARQLLCRWFPGIARLNQVADESSLPTGATSQTQQTQQGSP